MTSIARETEIPSQNLQQFMSDSPWNEQNPIGQVQYEISGRAEFQKGSVLIIDESADKSSAHKAGSSRQHNGNLGKIEQSQVGVFAGLVNNGHHCWIDGQLYVPEAWFTKEFAPARQKVGLPAQVVFQTKIQIALELIRNAYRRGVPFEAVDFDTLYGRNGWLRDELAKERIEYYGDVPTNTTVFLERPRAT
jgi:SRSO17 transposase